MHSWAQKVVLMALVGVIKIKGRKCPLQISFSSEREGRDRDAMQP
jgi:hypothetical protein